MRERIGHTMRSGGNDHSLHLHKYMLCDVCAFGDYPPVYENPHQMTKYIIKNK